MRFFEYLSVLALAAGTANAAAARIAIYPDENFAGTPQQFTTEADGKCWPVAPAYNNRISSFRVTLDPNVWCFFYDSTTCTNELFSVSTNWNNPKLGGANDKISSFKCQ
ncbi:hypothetical protein IFR04_012138 [Cadophora malorum]|uniref:Uncharacterized protein n=1 Tax=Cadophora malorum TaxID=108018 RepID=A0A8H7W8E9_9HELO|nr:hypothetical protein IFR04_012138 [Cadophora malorum]